MPFCKLILVINTCFQLNLLSNAQNMSRFRILSGMNLQVFSRPLCEIFITASCCPTPSRLSFPQPSQKRTNKCKWEWTYLYQALGVKVCLLPMIPVTFLQEAQTYAQENGLFFMETSAKTATNVNDIFYEIGIFHWEFFLNMYGTALWEMTFNHSLVICV